MSIQELIQKNKEFEKRLEEVIKYAKVSYCPVCGIMPKIISTFIKSLIDAVIESRRGKKIVGTAIEDIKKDGYGLVDINLSKENMAWNDAQDDTIKELKAIKELL
jgi:hypothetical protein